MIDEWFERWVDRLCEAVPRRMGPLLLRLSGTALGWRITLYASAVWGNVADAFTSLSKEGNVDSMIDEILGHDDRGLDSWQSAVYMWLMRVQLSVTNARFPVLLYLLALSALSVLASGGALAGGCAAAIALYWLAEGISLGYAPVVGRIRQRYLWAAGLRALADGALLLAYFRRYAAQSLPLNVVLQGAMIVTLFIHAVLFLALTAFNRRQPLLLRVLWGVLGVLPALSAAAAVAMTASRLAAPPLELAAAICSAVGAVLVFLARELEAMEHLGGIRLRCGALWQTAMQLLGLMLVLAGAWGAPV